jgi:hypothetical protein
VCLPGQGATECARAQWRKAGLADVGGIFFYWATVLGEYPYAHDSGGYALAAEDESGELREARTAFRVEVEGGYVLAGARRIAAAARVQLPFFVDIAAHYSLYVEPGAPDISTLTLGRVDLELRLLDGTGIQIRFGGGLRHFHDRLGSLLGGGVGVAVDVFPVRPLVLSASADAGIVGRATILRARASAGLVVDNTEVYLGYHYEALLGEGGAAADLGGVMIGVRLWL